MLLELLLLPPITVTDAIDTFSAYQAGYVGPAITSKQVTQLAISPPDQFLPTPPYMSIYYIAFRVFTYGKTTAMLYIYIQILFLTVNKEYLSIIYV